MQKFFNTLPNQIRPECIAPALFAARIINAVDLDMASNKYNPSHSRAQQLLLTLIGKVQAKPEWFDNICSILEKEISTGVEDLRGKYVLAALHAVHSILLALNNHVYSKL